MNNENFIFGYVESCASGRLPLGDCGPVWQMGVIAVLLVSAIAVLVMLRWRAGPQSAPG